MPRPPSSVREQETRRAARGLRTVLSRVCCSDELNGVPPPLRAPRPRDRARAPRPAATESTRRCPGPRQRARGHPTTPRPSAAACAATVRTVSARSSGLRTTPPLPSRSLPISNCGLTMRTRSASGAEQRTQRGQHQAERDEGEVAHDEVGGLAAQVVQRQLAYVRTVLHGDPVIALQGPGELSVNRRRRRRHARLRRAAAHR